MNTHIHLYTPMRLWAPPKLQAYMLLSTSCLMIKDLEKLAWSLCNHIFFTRDQRRQKCLTSVAKTFSFSKKNIFRVSMATQSHFLTKTWVRVSPCFCYELLSASLFLLRPALSKSCRQDFMQWWSSWKTWCGRSVTISFLPETWEDKNVDYCYTKDIFSGLCDHTATFLQRHWCVHRLVFLIPETDACTAFSLVYLVDT